MSLDRSLALILAVLLTSGLLACSSVKAAATYDPTVDFSRARTFAFRADRRLPDPNTQALVERHITADLTGKGFRRDDTAAELLIGLAPDVGGDVDRNTLPSGTVTWATMGPYDGVSVSAGGRDLRETGLVMTVRDARDHRLVWIGIAHGRAVIGEPKTNLKRARQALEKLLESFPPTTK